MAVIEKVLDTDTFETLVAKVNAVIDQCNGVMTETLAGAFESIKEHHDEIELLKNEVEQLKNQ